MSFLFFNFYSTLQYCIGFAIHWHESTTCVHAYWTLFGVCWASWIAGLASVICFEKFSPHWFICVPSSSASFPSGVEPQEPVLFSVSSRPWGSCLLFTLLFSSSAMVCVLSGVLSSRSQILFPTLFHLLLISEFWIPNFVFAVLECPFHIFIMYFNLVFKILQSHSFCLSFPIFKHNNHNYFKVFSVNTSMLEIHSSACVFCSLFSWLCSMHTCVHVCTCYIHTSRGTISVWGIVPVLCLALWPDLFS